MAQVNFLCIGAQKAGTSWLYSALQLHPAVTLHPIKELHFFDAKYRSGGFTIKKRRMIAFRCLKNRINILSSRVHSNYDPFFQEEDVSSIDKLRILKECQLKSQISLAFGNYSNSMYFSLFSHLNNTIVGEITPAYSTLPELYVQELRKLLGNIKIIYLVRNPKERVWSAFRMHCKTSGINIQNKEEVEILSMWNKSHCLLEYFDNRTNYSSTINLWRKYFESFKVFSYDLLKKDPSAFYKNICSFLGIGFEHNNFRKISGKIINPGSNVIIPPQIEDFLEKRYESQSSFIVNYLDSI